MADTVAGAVQREAASRRIVDLGFAYPDALDLRNALTRGNSSGTARGTVSNTSTALPHPAPDPGTVIEPTATHPQTQSAEGERSSVGGTP